jgi:arylsulfatase A-like enzyme
VKPQAVILIVIDALRADHLGCYGYHLPTSPHLDQFAKDAVVYKYAFSPCSYTIPAFAAIFTGKSPGNNSLWFQQKFGLNRDREITLAEILKSAGYKTAAFVSSLVMRKDWGLDVGFDIYNDKMTGFEANRPSESIRNGKETNNEIFKWLVNEGHSPFFLFIHYFDVHGPYVNVEPYDSIFRVEDYGKKPLFLDRVLDGKEGGIPDYQILKAVKNEAGENVDFEKDARYYFSQYDGGIRYSDDMFGDLIERLKEKDIYDDALIIITADHGEAMGENNVYFFHGLTVSFEQIRVPLLIKTPTKKTIKSKVVEEPVSTIDIFPTILNACEANNSRFEVEGVNILNKNSNKRIILSENQWQRAIIRGNYIFNSEKRNIYSDYVYYYDSRQLSAGRKLYNYIGDSDCKNNLLGKVSEEKEFVEIDNFFSLHVNPKEQLIGEKDRKIETIRQELKLKEQQIQSIFSSRTWKVGRIATAPWRFIKKIFHKNR